MCEAKPGVRCANDTRAQVSVALSRYQDAHPDGPTVDPLAAAEASMDTPISVPNPDDPTDMPIYEGPASGAADKLVPGTYTAEHLHDGGSYQLTVTPVTAEALQTSAYDYKSTWENWDGTGTNPQDAIAGRIAVYTDFDGNRIVGTVAATDGHFPQVEFTDGRHARLDGTIELVDDGAPTGGLENVPAGVQQFMNEQHLHPDKRAAAVDACQNPDRRKRCRDRAIQLYRSEAFYSGGSSDMSDEDITRTPAFPEKMTTALMHSGEREGAYWAWKEGRAHPDDAAYEDIWAGRKGGFSEEKVRASLAESRQMLEDLEAKRVRPSKVVGTGYKNPRKVALEYLHREIAQKEEAIASRGRSDSVNQANVHYAKWTAARRTD